MLNSIKQLSPRKRIFFDSGILLLAAILVCLPIWLNGIPATQDIPQQFQFAQSFYNSIADGVFYPSWADQPNWGYGDVSVRFYPPLTYYILSLFRLLTGNWFDASLLFFISFYFFSGLGVYTFCRQYFAATASVVGGVIYIWLPYHVMQIYLGGLFAEFTAAAILPFCLLFINRVCEKGKIFDICGLSFTYALILLTHLPTSMIASLTFLVYVLFSFKKENLVKSLLNLSISVGLSFLLSGFYLIRMLSEIDWVKHSGESFSTGEYLYKTQFIFSYYFPFLDITRASAFASSNLMSLLTLGIILPGLIYCYTKKIGFLKNVAAITFFGLFMATPLSLLVWEVISPLQKIQFPFRWLTIFTLGAAILSAASFTSILELYKTPKRYISLSFFGLFLLIVTFNYNNLMSSDITFPKDFLQTIINRFKTMPSYECWWTTWAQKSSSLSNRPGFLPDKIASESRTFEILSWEATKRVFTINEGEAGKILVATLYYPHWKATVNGSPVAVSPNETGLISLQVPPEKSEVELYFQEPSYVITGFYISGAAWIIFFVLLAFSAIYNYKKSEKI